jgi:hypothetical protein
MFAFYYPNFWRAPAIPEGYDVITGLRMSAVSTLGTERAGFSPQLDDRFVSHHNPFQRGSGVCFGC